jgi:hypothetical protein
MRQSSFDELIVAQVVNLPIFMGPEDSLPCSDIPPLNPILCHMNLVHIFTSFLRSNLILSSHIVSVFQFVSSSQVF